MLIMLANYDGWCIQNLPGLSFVIRLEQSSPILNILVTYILGNVNIIVLIMLIMLIMLAGEPCQGWCIPNFPGFNVRNSSQSLPILTILVTYIWGMLT